MLIKKGKTILNVSKGAYLASFKAQGWAKAESGQTPKKERAMMSQPEPASGDVVPVEVPFGNMMQQEPEPVMYNVVYEEMTVKQLLEFAEEYQIDLRGATKKSDIVHTIRKAMEKR